MFVKFGDNNAVTVASEKGKADQTETSMYELIADSGPVLTFNTHNSLFHYFSDPNNPDESARLIVVWEATMNLWL